MDRVGIEQYEAAFGPANLVDAPTLRALQHEASEAAEDHRFSDRFLETEWSDVVDAWELSTWESYRDVARLGRKTRLGENQRALLWSIFVRVRSELAERDLVTLAGAFAAAAAHAAACGESPYDFIVVDESQDISVPQLRFLAALRGEQEDGLFFAGDLGQRIFQTPFSWRSLGVDVRGRSSTLRINYRTSHQIRRQADLLLPPEMSDVDGNTDTRRGTVSAFNGPEPTVAVLETVEEEAVTIAEWIGARTQEGVPPEEIGVFVRSEAELERARAAVEAAGLTAIELDGGAEDEAGHAAVGTMHLAKGLEFRAVVVAACDDEVIPLQSRIEAVADTAGLEDVYNTERHLLYVACTRARDVVDPAGRDALDVGLLDHGEQGALGAPARLEQGREVAALAQLRDLQLDAAGARVPAPRPVAVAPGAALGAALAVGGAGLRGDLGPRHNDDRAKLLSTPRAVHFTAMLARLRAIPLPS